MALLGSSTLRQRPSIDYSSGVDSLHRHVSQEHDLRAGQFPERDSAGRWEDLMLPETEWVSTEVLRESGGSGVGKPRSPHSTHRRVTVLGNAAARGFAAL